VLAAPVEKLGVRHDRDGELEARRIRIPLVDVARRRRNLRIGDRGRGPQRAERHRPGAGQPGVAQGRSPVLSTTWLWRRLLVAVANAHDSPRPGSVILRPGRYAAPANTEPTSDDMRRS